MANYIRGELTLFPRRMSMVSESQEYYLSTSQTELIGGEWQSTVPTITDGTYLWLRRKITNSDNNTTYTVPVCLTSSVVNNNVYTENDRIQYNRRVAAGDYISAGTIAAFDTTLGLVELSAGLNLDTTKPILYSASEVEQSAVTTDMFLMHSDVDLREITGDQSMSVSDGLGVYLKGTLEDTVFTLESDWLVFGDPTTEGSENYTYVLLGHTGASTLEAVSYSMTLESEHPMYACGIAKDGTETKTGSIVTFNDAVGGYPLEALTVAVEPQQDLHGQASPYPAGGGKNLIPTTLSELKTANTDGAWNDNVYSVNYVTFTVNLDNGGNVESITANGTASAQTSFWFPSISLNAGQYIVSKCPSGSSTTTFLYYVSGISTTEVYDSDTTINPSSAGTLSTRIVVRNGVGVSNKIFHPMIRLASISDATFAPYSNICPITGHTGANVTRAGRNLFDPDTDNIIDGGNHVSISGDTITNTSAAAWSPVRWSIGLIKAGTYTFSCESISENGVIQLSKLYNGSYIQITYLALPTLSNTVTISEDVANAVISIYSVSAVQVVVKKLQLESGSAAHAYEPYQGSVLPISWQSTAGTVYGGTLDVTRGKLTVDRAIVDLGTLNWIIPATNIFQGTPTNMLNPSTYLGRREGIMCSAYKVDSGVSISDSMASKSMLRAYGNIYIKDTDYSDASVFKTAMSGVQLVYELATPQTYTLDPVTISTLRGDNTVWADTGDVTELKYGEYHYQLIPYDESIRIISEDAIQQLANVDQVVMMPNGQMSTLSKWMTFSPNNSLVIGASKDGEEEPQKLQLTSEKISFMYGTQEKAWITSEGFFFNQGKVVKSLRIGGYIIRDDGHGGFAIV